MVLKRLLLYVVFFIMVAPFANAVESFTFDCAYKNGEEHILTARLVETEKDRLYFDTTYGNPIAMEHYMNGIPRPTEEITKRFNWAISRKTTGTPWSVWLLFTEAQDFLGLVKLEPTDREKKPHELEISYVMNPIHWNKGICTKAVGALLKKAEEEWIQTYQIDAEHNQGFSPVTQVYATASPINPASCKVLTNNGFEVEAVKENVVSMLRVEENNSNAQKVEYGSARNIYSRRLIKK